MKELSLISSHLAIFAFCLLTGRSLFKAPDKETETTAPTKSERSLSPSLPTQELLSAFLPQKKSAYKDLAQTIDPSTDFASHLTRLLNQVDIPSITDGLDLRRDSIEEVELYSKIHAHVYQWLKTDPEAFASYLQENSNFTRILRKEPPNGILDHIAETGILNNLELIQSIDGQNYPSFLGKAIEQEFENGATLSLLDQLESEAPQFSHGSVNILWLIADHISFDQREAFVERALSFEEPEPYLIESFLRNKSHPQSEVVSWFKDLISSEKFNGEIEKRLRSSFATWLQNDADQLTPNERIELSMAEIGGKTQKVTRKVGESEVRDFLDESSLDYRYQFRHGQLTAQEIGQLFSEQYPEALAQTSLDSVRLLYQQLAEEDPEGALPILDLLNNPARSANIRYYSFMSSFYNVSPDQLLIQTESLPPPAGPGQEKIRDDAWKFHSGNLLKRHGEDYVQWVAEMKPGPQKDAAIQWTTRRAEEIFPHQAEAISHQLKASQNP